MSSPQQPRIMGLYDKTHGRAKPVWLCGKFSKPSFSMPLSTLHFSGACACPNGQTPPPRPPRLQGRSQVRPPRPRASEGEMAGRFVFQELASGMSRSTSRLGAQGSAWSGATAPVITASVRTKCLGRTARFSTATGSCTRAVSGAGGGGEVASFSPPIGFRGGQGGTAGVWAAGGGWAAGRGGGRGQSWGGVVHRGRRAVEEDEQL